jgi:hypothetical protein
MKESKYGIQSKLSLQEDVEIAKITLFFSAIFSLDLDSMHMYALVLTLTELTPGY